MYINIMDIIYNYSLVFKVSSDNF